MSSADPIFARRRKIVSGFTLVEVMVAVAILGLSLSFVMGGISYMRFRNRESSQRMLAASIQTEMLELFKAQPFPQITNSTAAAPVYLKQVPGGAPDTRWKVPVANSWESVPVEDVAPDNPAAPVSVANKLPNGVWRADFVTDPATPTLRQVTVTMQWQLYPGNNQRVVSLSTSTAVCQNFPSL